LNDSTGTRHRLDDIEGDRVMLIFFRGFWCESCQAQLERLKAEHEEFVDRGAVTVAISSDTPKIGDGLAESLPFLVLCDSKLVVIRQYGILHQPDDRGPGIAHPSVFVLDRTRTVRYAYIGADPDDRPKIEALLLALESI